MTPSADETQGPQSENVGEITDARVKRLDLIEKLFLVVFGLLTTAFGAILMDIHGKVDTLSTKQNADFLFLVTKLNDSSEKIGDTIKKIEIDQAVFQVKEDRLDAIISQKQRHPNP